MKGKSNFEGLKQQNQLLARKFLISLDKAVTETNTSNIIKETIDQITSKFISIFTKIVTEKIIQGLTFEKNSQQAIELISYSNSLIDGGY